MKKSIKEEIRKTDQDNFHDDGRNELERFMLQRIPAIIKAYGLGNIRFYFKTYEKKVKEHPQDGIFAIEYDPTYKAAYITITENALYLYDSKEYKTLSDALVHEVGHIVTHRLEQLAKQRHTTRKDIDDTVEETTESIAQIVRILLSKVDPMFKF